MRIDVKTHQDLKRLAQDLGETVGETVALAVRKLRQDQIGQQLAEELMAEEVEWLDADFG